MDGQTVAGQRILIVEDDPDQLDELKEYLLYQGYDVAGVGDGPQALGCIKEVNPRAIIMDIDLPGISGISTAEYITAMNPAQVIIFVSAFPEKAADAAARTGLSITVMRKPLDLEKCLLTLRSVSGTDY